MNSSNPSNTSEDLILDESETVTDTFAGPIPAPKRIGFMIDTEGLGLSHDSICTSVAIVAFDLDDPDTTIRVIEEFLPVEPQRAIFNRSWSFGTFLFWLKQPPEVQAQLFLSDGDDLDELISLIRSVCRKFRQTAQSADHYEVWVRRPQHDIPILNTLIMACGESVPWQYDTINDVATIMNAAGISSKDVPFTGSNQKHKALADCRFQIASYVEAFRRLRANI